MNWPVPPGGDPVSRCHLMANQIRDCRSGRPGGGELPLGRTMWIGVCIVFFFVPQGCVRKLIKGNSNDVHLCIAPVNSSSVNLMFEATPSSLRIFEATSRETGARMLK
jgi:hypothetical protein